MISKIFCTLLALALLAGGYAGIVKLSYFERSVRIFKLNSAQNLNERGRGFGRDFRDGERPARPFTGELPDSVRQKFDSQKSKFQRTEGPGEGNRMNRGDRHGGYGGRTGGKKIYLRNVSWFMLVFASFTVIVMYLDKIYCYFRKKRAMAKVIHAG